MHWLCLLCSYLSCLEELTSGTLRAVRDLFCDGVGRTIQSVFFILETMARRAEVVAPSYEAIWALCICLVPRRAQLDPRICHTRDDKWKIDVLAPNVRVTQPPKDDYIPYIACVHELPTYRVLSFRVGDEITAADAASLAVYDAITACRIPTASSRSGLLYDLPYQLITEVIPPTRMIDGCESLGIEVRVLTHRNEYSGSSLAKLLGEGWWRCIRYQRLSRGHLERTFDNFLDRRQSFAPRRSTEELSRRYAHSLGYRKDPCATLPTLREMLPVASSHVSSGHVSLDGLSYTHDMLELWPDHAVDVVRSSQEEATAWIYLEDHLICSAKAVELRRKDGTYRANR